MSIEIVHNHPNQFRLRIVPVDQQFHAPCEIVLGAPVRDLDVPPPTAWLKEHEQVTGAVAFILIIIPLGFPGLQGLRLPYLSHQLIGTLVKTHHWIAGVIGLGIEIEQVFHAPDKLPTYAGDAPLPPLPRFEGIFLRVRRTVSSEMDSTSPTSTTRSANNCIVQ